MSEHGQVYFYNRQTAQSAWSVPPAPPTAQMVARATETAASTSATITTVLPPSRFDWSIRDGGINDSSLRASVPAPSGGRAGGTAGPQPPPLLPQWGLAHEARIATLEVLLAEERSGRLLFEEAVHGRLRTTGKTLTKCAKRYRRPSASWIARLWLILPKYGSLT